MGKNSKRNKNRKDKKCDEVQQSQKNAELQGRGKHGGAGHSNIGASHSTKKNSSNENQCKNDIHNKSVAEEKPQHRFSTSLMNDIEHDEEEHKLDYAGAVIDYNIGVDNTIASDGKKEETSNNNKCTKMLNHKNNYGEKGSQCGWSTNVMNTKLHEKNIKGSTSNHDQQPNRKEMKISVVREVKGDLFSAPTEYSLAHCVAADMRMGSGIATTFRQMFKRVDDLLAQKKHVGDVAVLYIEKENRFIYYLVTKIISTGKPKIYDLDKSLLKMKEHIVENNVHKLAMPRIGCGLDRLEWSDVLPMIERIFHDIDIDIVVYDFSQDQAEELTNQQQKPRNKKGYLCNKRMNLVDIVPDTAYIFIGTEDGFVDSTIESLDGKFQIMQEYKRANRKLGDVIKIVRRDYFYGLIAKEKGQHCISYKDLGNCLVKLRKFLQTDEYEFVGFEAFFDDDDTIAINKVITLFNNYLISNFKVWVCWPDYLILKFPDSYLPNFSQTSFGS